MIAIDGAWPELGEANGAFAGSVANRTLSVNQLFEAARILERAYIRRGYVLVRVVIPPQRLADGAAVRLRVVDGFVEAIDVSALAPRLRDLVQARLAPLIGQRRLSQDTLERHLLIAGDMAGATLRSGIAAGTRDGGVKLVVAGTTAPLAVWLGADNALPASLGRWQMSATVSLNNLMGQGDQFYLVGGAQPNPGRIGQATAPLTLLAGGVMVPIGKAGVTAAAEVLSARTVPLPAPGAPASVGNYVRREVRIQVPLVLTRRESLTLTATGDLVTQSLRLPEFDTIVSRDRYAALRIGLGHRRWVREVLLTSNVVLSQGLGGSHPTALVGSSRDGASPTFTRLTGELGLTFPMRDGFALAWTGRAQAGFGRPLLLSEQFALDAADAVSATEAGSFNVDSGATLRAEFRFLSNDLGAHLGISPYLFGAIGAGRLEADIPGQFRGISAAAFGFGLRAAIRRMPVIGGVGPTTGFEFGRQISDVPGRRGRDRANLTLALRY